MSDPDEAIDGRPEVTGPLSPCPACGHVWLEREDWRSGWRRQSCGRPATVAERRPLSLDADP